MPRSEAIRPSVRIRPLSVRTRSGGGHPSVRPSVRPGTSKEARGRTLGRIPPGAADLIFERSTNPSIRPNINWRPWMKTEARCRFDPSAGQRIGPAWVLILEALEDREWHSWSEVVSALAPQTHLHPKTISNLLYSGVAHGYLARKGRHPHRRVRLISKNTSCECGAAK